MCVHESVLRARPYWRIYMNMFERAEICVCTCTYACLWFPTIKIDSSSDCNRSTVDRRLVCLLDRRNPRRDAHSHRPVYSWTSGGRRNARVAVLLLPLPLLLLGYHDYCCCCCSICHHRRRRRRRHHHHHHHHHHNIIVAVVVAAAAAAAVIIIVVVVTVCTTELL